MSLVYKCDVCGRIDESDSTRMIEVCGKYNTQIHLCPQCYKEFDLWLNKKAMILSIPEPTKLRK